ncbi:MAG: threonine-phosphate decarboxylase CobD [Hyphomicrobiales bacterium]
MASPVHGGDLKWAMALSREFGFETGDLSSWIDLSTGINPRPYPVPALDPALWHALPTQDLYRKLIDAAVKYYNVPSSQNLLAASGSALLIQLLPSLFEGQAVSIVSPTYGDHEQAWRRSNANCSLIKNPHEHGGGILVLTNPNNPDGRTYSADELLALAEKQTSAGSWLIVDEAFADLADEGKSTTALVENFNVIILKSVGKFFGLAGARLGFMVAPTAIIEAMAKQIGSWPVSAPALEIGFQALSDNVWQKETLQFLTAQTQSVLMIFKEAKIPVVGGTDLFTLVDQSAKPSLFKELLRARIYVRAFDYNRDWLRIGLPKNDRELARLKAAVNLA